MNPTDENETETNIRGGLRSASGAAQWINCPNSFKFQKDFPEEPTQIWAKDGTAIADALERDTVEELEEDLRPIAEQLQEMEQNALAAWRARYGIEGEIKPWREIRYWMRDANMNPIVSGQIDKGYYDPHTRQLLIIDDKTGYLDPDSAERNYQLLCQASCIYEDHKFVGVTMAIAHVRLRKNYDDAFYTDTQIIAARAMIENSIIRGEDPFAPRYPGDWCRYCNAKSGCKEAHAWLLVDTLTWNHAPCGMCGSHFSCVNEDKAAVTVHTGPLTNKHAAGIFQKISVGGKIWDAIKTRLKALSEDELTELGLVLRPAGETRKIIDKDRARKLLLPHLTEVEFDNACVANLGLLELAVKEQSKLSKKDAKSEVDRLLDPVIDRKPKSPTLKALK